MRSSAAILGRCSSPVYFRFWSDTAEQRAKISVRFAAKQSKSRPSANGQLRTSRLIPAALWPHSEKHTHARMDHPRVAEETDAPCAAEQRLARIGACLGVAPVDRFGVNRSVVVRRPATDAASWRAARTTFAGSVPAWSMSTYSSFVGLKPKVWDLLSLFRPTTIEPATPKFPRSGGSEPRAPSGRC